LNSTRNSCRAPSLRRAAEQAEEEQEERKSRLREHLASLADRVDLDVLASDEMWR
jgi:hypothetical protein